MSLIYLLKANICLSIFLVIYWIFLRRVTFYRLNRWYFLVTIGLCLILPALDLSVYVTPHLQESKMLVAYTESLEAMELSESISQTPTIISPEKNIIIDFEEILQAILLSGSLLFLCKFLVQIMSIIRLIKTSNILFINKLKIFQPQENSSPFSFFKFIFINPEQYSDEDLSEILTHERTHAEQWHSVDAVLAEVLCIVLWINPLSWIMKRFLKQNLEFLTDKIVLDTGFNLRHYQYNLLKINGLSLINVANNFNFSDLKLRIRMMNAQHSSRFQLLKYSITIPLGAMLILGFNVSKVRGFNAQKSVIENIKETLTAINFTTHTTPKSEHFLASPYLDEDGMEDSFKNIHFADANAELTSVDSAKTKKKYGYLNVDIVDNITNEGLKDAQIYNHTGELLGTTNPQGIAIINYPEPYKSIKEDSVKIGEKYYPLTTQYHKMIIRYKNLPEFELNFFNFQKSIHLIINNGKIELAKPKSVSNNIETIVANSPEKPKDKKHSLYYLQSNGKPYIEPDIKLFYCREDAIKELKKTQELSSEKRPVYLINTKQVAENYDFDNVVVNSISMLQYWKPEYSVQIGKEYGKQSENGMYNLVLLERDEKAYQKYLAYKLKVSDEPVKNYKPKTEKCTPSQDFPPNALYVIDGKEVDSGYLHKHIKPEEIDKLEVMNQELANVKYGTKGKKGVILISTKKVNKLGEN